MIFQYRPVIHSKGSELNFYRFLLRSISRIDWYLHNEMEASISIFLGIFYIIFDLKNFNIFLKECYENVGKDIEEEFDKLTK